MRINNKATVSIAAIALMANAAFAQAVDRTIVDRYTEVCEWMTDVKYTPAQREELRAQVEAYWRNGDQRRIDTVMKALEMHRELVAQMQAAMSSNRWAGMQSHIDAYTQNSATIMGSGTSWNSSTGRWEQRGGVVTEFDSGVVRVP